MFAIELNTNNMKDKMSYKHFGHFVIRTPLLAVNEIRDLVGEEEVSKDKLTEICRKPYIKEALYLASPSFYTEVEKWLAGKLPTTKEENKVMLGIIRYYARMSTRCTPFGMFSGISTGEITDKNNIQLSDIDNNRLHIRLDMNYVCALAQDLAKKASVRNKIKFFPNNSAYIIGDRLRYVEYGFSKSKRSHHISAVDNSSYLQKILNAAGKGLSFDELVSCITDEEINADEAGLFVNEMIDSQLLTSELEPTVIGIDPLMQIIKTLKQYEEDIEIKDIINSLSTVDNALKILSTEKFVHDISEYGHIKEYLDCFPTQYDEKYLFQADMTHKTDVCTISESLADDILNTIGFLNKISRERENENLKKFREAFYERYEDEEMPLAQVLDTETGIGYMQNTDNGVTPLIDDIIFPYNSYGGQSVRLNTLDVLMQKKLSEALRLHKKEIELKDDDFAEEAENDNTPATIMSFIQLIDDKHFYFHSGGGSSAVNLIGRFCHTDSELLALAKEIVSKDEEQQDYIYAEIVHLPESRIGNILHRPTIRKYEIPYLAYSSVAAENCIPLEDLYVSVRGNKILLRSGKLNKTVVPRLGTAHNYSFNSLPVYHFLCDMQTSGIKSGFGFSWGMLQGIQPYLPRVIYKNAILSLETWNFFSNDISELNKIKDTEKQIEKFQRIAKSLGIKDEVVLEDNDNELYLNIANKTCVKVLLDLIKKRNSFTLKEFVFSGSKNIVGNKEYCHANEILIPFYKTGSKS